MAVWIQGLTMQYGCSSAVHTPLVQHGLGLLRCGFRLQFGGRGKLANGTGLRAHRNLLFAGFARFCWHACLLACVLKPSLAHVGLPSEIYCCTRCVSKPTFVLLGILLELTVVPCSIPHI